MKNLRIHAVCVCIAVMSISSTVNAQVTPPVNEPNQNKPRLFDNLPDRIPIDINKFTPLFTSAIGAEIDLGVSEKAQFQFDGEVVSTASKFDNKLQSVVIRSSNYNGAGFTISKITNDDGSVIYKGRIISLKHGDLFELQKEADGYVLVKRNFYDLVNE